MRIIICGSRDWKDYSLVENVIIQLVKCLPKGEKLEVKHGNAKGADKIADMCALNQGILPQRFPYRSDFHKGGGPARNKKMLDSGADGIVAFKDNFDFTMIRNQGHGTEDMVRQGVDAKVSWIRLFDTQSTCPVLWTTATFWMPEPNFWLEPEPEEEESEDECLP